MRDIVFLSVVVAFFGLALAYVRACESLVGTPDELTTTTPHDPSEALLDDATVEGAAR